MSQNRHRLLYQDLRSTAIHDAKIIIFKILPLYIVPLCKSYILSKETQSDEYSG
jgi:hypothetical protein